MVGVWPVVHAERAALAHDLNGLTDEQWATPSLCPGWDVQDVVAHIVDTARTTRFSFVRDLARARFDFDRQNADGIRRERTADPRDTLESLRSVLSRTTTPPAAPATRLVEMFVHGEDIRRPLGIHRDYPNEAVIEALQYQVRTPVKWGGGKERAAGLRLVADDAPAEAGIGVGDVVRGSGIALLLAVSGRPVADGELTGPGAAALIGLTPRS